MSEPKTVWEMQDRFDAAAERGDTAACEQIRQEIHAAGYHGVAHTIGRQDGAQ